MLGRPGHPVFTRAAPRDAPSDKAAEPVERSAGPARDDACGGAKAA